MNELFLIVWLTSVVTNGATPGAIYIKRSSYAETAYSSKAACKIIRQKKKDKDVMEIRTFRIQASNYVEVVREIEVLCE